ncbi:hypothetical protein F5I97DRAFT_838066 [Phlebopus sp. FC_14]|nr:hypothetical protein F5I97DRAFT_838066 [Phlebopus sp. FC_14]
MMRSGSTMKVSLTPDRLRTMEMLTKDKARTNGRQKGKTEGVSRTEASFVPTSPEQPKRAKKQSLRQVDSIIEDEEERSLQRPPPTSRPRQLSAATASGYNAASFTRLRSSSTSEPPKTNATPKHLMRCDSKSFPTPSNSGPASITRRKAAPQELDINASRPPRTRTIARNRESLDLDDVMGGSDEENMEGGLKPSASAKQRGLSASARDLIDFLAEGPPEVPNKISSMNESSPSLTPKKSGRLQKMISKITLTGSNDSSKSSRGMTVGSQDTANKSTSNLSPLANRPIPPRYPTSGPPSSSSSDRNSGDQEVSRQRTQSFIRRPVPAWNSRAPDPGPPLPTASGLGTVIVTPSSVGTISKEASESDCGKRGESEAKATPSSPSASSPRTGSPPPFSAASVVQPAAPIAYVPERVSSKALIEQARDMRKLLAHAMSADECRLLVDMFLARTKLVPNTELQTLATACLDSGCQETISNMEKTVVGLFLGDSEPERSAPSSMQHDQLEVNADHPRSPALECNTKPAETP